MASKNKYNLMQESSIVTDTYGNYYPDLATFDINYFIPSSKPLAYKLLYNDIYRFDLLINSYYTSFDLYDDLTLWLNDIPYLTISGLQQTIYFYAKADIDSYYKNNSYS
jgi:hypothetical protein